MIELMEAKPVSKDVPTMLHRGDQMCAQEVEG